MSEPRPRWEIILTRQAEKTLYRLSKNLLQRLDQALLALGTNPRPPEAQQLPGHDHLYSLHVDKWRIAYAVEDERLVVLILEIAPKQQPERYRLEEETDKPPSATSNKEWMENALASEDFYKALMKQAVEDHIHHRTLGATPYDEKIRLLGVIKGASQEKIRLLIVDDMPETRENLRKLLFFESDIEVVGTATNGGEAIQMAVEQQPDVVLMDIIMPGINGFTATEIICEQVPTAQVIMMSVHGEADFLRQAMLAGAKEFLIKPFSSDELITSIRRVYQLAALQKRHAAAATAHLRDAFKDLKERIQAKLVAELDPTVDVSRPDEIRRAIQDRFERILAQENIILSRSERERLLESIVTEILGLVDPSSRAVQEKIRLLIVDNISATREKLNELLSTEPDIEIIGAATNGEEAIQMAVEWQPDVVLMEIILPGINGLTACEIISQQVPLAKIIMMSAYSADYLRRSMLAGATEFLTKGVSPRELMNSIRRVGHSGRASQEKIRLLVVGDNSEILENVRQFVLSESDIEIVGIVTNIEAAIQMARELLPDIVFTDVSTAGINFLQDPAATIAMVSVQDGTSYPEYSAMVGSRELLEKPFSKDELVNSIRRVYQSTKAGRASIRVYQAATKLSQSNQVLEEEGTELDEAQQRTVEQWFKFYKLGNRVEISLSVANLSESLSFYEKLDFEKVDGGEKPYPWAVVSDGRLHLGLHQQIFSSPTLSYFGLGIVSERMTHLPKLGIRLDNIQKLEPIVGMQHNELLYSVKFVTAEFESSEGQRVLLADIASDVETTPRGRKFFAKCEKFGELSLKTDDVNTAVAYWEKLGFERVAEGDQPYPWAIVSDGLIRLGFHQTPKLAQPTITYFAPDMPERLKRLRKKGLKFIAEHKDKKGRRVGAVIESPDGQPFFLFTGEITSPKCKETKAAEAKKSSQPEPTVGVGEENRPRPEDAQWYMIYGYSGNEFKVRQNLLQRVKAMGLQHKIFQVVVPPNQSGILQVSSSSLLSGSLLVKMVMDEDSWSVVNNTPGVTGFVGSGSKPTPLPPDEVNKILKR